ncbi:MAG: LamG domain-containing protein [Cyanophyceae cyanobacterium]
MLDKSENNVLGNFGGSSLSFDEPLIGGLASEPLVSELLDNLVLNLSFENLSGLGKDSLLAENSGELRNGTAVIFSNSLLGNVAVFDGIDDFIHVNDSSDTNLSIQAQRSVSLWVKVDDKNSSRKQVLYEEGGSARGLNIYIDKGQLYAGGWNRPATESGWKGTYLATEAIASNTWHHVVVVLDAEEGKKRVQDRVFAAYLDGKQFGQGQGSQLWSHSDDLGLGAINQQTRFHDGLASGTGTKSFSGLIDNVQVYNRALSPQEIALTAELAAETDDASADNLVAYFNFEEASGNQLTDSSFSGTDHLGKLRNGAQLIDSKFGNQTPGVVDFDETNDYVKLSSSAEINLGTHAKRTILLWFNLDNKDASSKQVIYEEGGTGRGLNIYVENGRLYVGGWNQPTTESGWKGTYLSTEAIASNTWHHVALVLDAEAGAKSLQTGVFSAYLDGVKFQEGQGSQLWSHGDGIGLGAINGSTKFHDGEVSGTGTRGLAGRVDELKIYNRALAASEIAHLADPPPKSVHIGTNLAGISHWSSQLPFLDIFKTAKPWTPQKAPVPEQGTPGIWDTREYEHLDLDEHGWVKSLPAADDPLAYTHVGTLIHRDIGDYPGGQYIVLYDGEGTIEYGFDARKDEAASQLGRDVLRVTPSNSGIYLKITETDPNQTGDYIRNIRIVPEADEATYTAEIFNPDFIENANDFEVFRFMDWMKTTDSEQKEWSNRPSPETATFSSAGVSVERMVELANLLDTAPWFSMPHQATDEYVQKFAQYVKENLDPDLEIYVEYSNEVWNPEFEQHHWVREQSQQEWPESKNGNTQKKINWFSKRTTEIAQQWDEVFGDDQERVIGVMGAQAANVWVAERALEYAWSSEDKSHEDYGIDAIAIAPYFGSYLGRRQHEQEVASWTTKPDGGLDKLFDEITQGGVLSNGPEGGALQKAYAGINAHVELANRENLELIAYEGGQHLVGKNGVQENHAITQLFIEANRDSRMGEVYKEYLAKWFELGGSTFVNFTDASIPSKWGSWGTLEHINQESSPKYDALQEIMLSSDVSLSVV